MAFNHELLSAQRLRNLAGRFPLPPGLVAAVTAWARQTAPENLPASDQAVAAQDREPVFSPDVLVFVSKQDPVLAQHGFIRPPAVRTGKSHKPDLALPVNLAFGFAAYSGQAAAPRRCEYCSPGQTAPSTPPRSPTKQDSPNGTSAMF